MISGPIILVEDDDDDREIFEEVLNELKVTNELIWFNNCPEAFDFLLQTEKKPFFILCDVNLPGQTGLELKKNIDSNEYLRNKSIPFIFYSTSVAQIDVNTAYKETSVQGFFQKDLTYDLIRSKIKIIIDYWNNCKHPNS
jgi:CheY-like chemotaxis protein